MKKLALGVAIMMLASSWAGAQFVQQGERLIGTGAVGPAGQGNSVALSADGNTAIMGGPNDNGNLGAAWVFARSGGVWVQQGSKLVGTGAVPDALYGASQGYSVALSADGNTAIVGGPGESGETGAAWVFTRSGGVWTQQGEKLVGTDAGGSTDQGSSVALSADGNTAIVGGPFTGVGAAWVFTRSGGVWTQQGPKLVGTGAVGSFVKQGASVALSADGATAMVGGPGDSYNTGAAWVFTRSGGVWTQQGEKLVGTGAVSVAAQGDSVALSADGNTAIVGGSRDNNLIGATWVFTRSGGVWMQQGEKLVATGTEYSDCVRQGYSVSLSGDGNTAIVGGPCDNFITGAAWVFTRSGGVWTQLGEKLVGTGVDYGVQGASVGLSADGSTAVVGGPAAEAAWVFTRLGGPGNALWVPVVSHNTGKNDSEWRSDVGLLNTGAATANVEITFHGPQGVVMNTTFVPAGAQSVLVDVVAQLAASGQGALEVVSDQPLKVTSRTYNQVSSVANCHPNGTQGQDYPTLHPSDGLSQGHAAWLPQLAENAAYRTNIGLVNTGPDTAGVTVELYDGAGSLLTSYTVSLATGNWRQETQPFKNKAGQTAMDRGYARVTVTSGAGVFGFASVIDNITNDPTTITMQR
jgi:lipocalin